MFLWRLLLVFDLVLGLRVTDTLLKEGDDFNNAALADALDGENFVHIKLDIANRAWSSDLETETTPTYLELESDLVESLELSLNSSDLMSIKILSVGKAADNATISCSIGMVFATDYTWYFASRLMRKFKPNYGKTKGLGGLRISRFVAKPFIKLIDKTVYRKITRAPAPDEKPEYFNNLYEMKVFAENEED